ncbi:hypothetical protein MAP00_005578 [Monascus purpureus]|nr:hypothetical protein MAP00_005578 [Monascus purpureus]
MEDSTQYRHIVPGPSPTSEGSPPRDTAVASSSQWKKRVSTACLACKKSKRKCSGVPPCDNCRAFNRVCIFDESLDQRRRVAAKRTVDELNYHRNLLNDLFKVIRSADESQALRLLDLIRSEASSEQIRSYIDDTLTAMEGTDKGTRDAVDKLQDIRQRISIEGVNPSFRRKVMDVHYLCDDAPFKVPARPWTSVTEDDDLVSHLVSLYFTWDYPFYSFLDCDVFIKHMAAGKLGSEFCNPFLVNAILANACHFSEFSEAYVVPGDIMTKGVDFLAEAERLRDAEEGGAVSLATLQGTLLLYERYSMSENDDLGYTMLHRAIKIGESLGLVGDQSSPLNPKDMPKDRAVSLQRTAWGLFQIDTLVHTGFRRPSLVSRVNVSRLDRDTFTQDELWVPYPSHRAARPAYISQYFDESCTLCDLAREVSRTFFAGNPAMMGPGFRRRETREDLYEQLKDWHDRLPDIFDPSRKPPPHIILLRMHYHTIVINLWSSSTVEDDETPTAGPSAGPQTPESESSTGKYNPSEVTLASARAISRLTRLHRREFGMSRAHHFALYAINLALFAMLEDSSFDVLDHDFLSLSSAFSIVGSRSPLGRNLFHIFRQSVRAKHQGHRVRSSSTVPEDLRELFDEEASTRTRWDEYAEGLQKLDSDERYRGRMTDGEQGRTRSPRNFPGLSLFDMLDRYESLSLGKDEMLLERAKMDTG